MVGWSAFRLTTVRQPVARMAEIGLRLILDRIAGAGPPEWQDVRLPGSLIVRESTGLASGSGGTSGRAALRRSPEKTWPRARVRCVPS